MFLGNKRVNMFHMSLKRKRPELTWNASANCGEKNAEQQHGAQPLRPPGEKQHPRVLFPR